MQVKVSGEIVLPGSVHAGADGLSGVFACPDGQRDRGGLSALREPFERQAGVEERMEQAGQGEVGGASAHLVVGMVATQVLGLAICRYVLKFPPLAKMPGDQVAARFSPTLQRYLTGPLEPPSPAPATSAERKKQAAR